VVHPSLLLHPSPLSIRIARVRVYNDKAFSRVETILEGNTTMLLRLILLFTLVPLLELYLLLAIAVRTSPQFTFALVIATGVLGAVLARRQGFRWRQKMATQLQQGEVPTDGLLDGLMIFIAGALLLTPGVLTDLLGFALLITPLRSLVKARIRRKIAQSFGVSAEKQYQWPTGQNAHNTNRDMVIESHVIENPRGERETDG
jgi:UPF0716 protein FxsA